ncbi:MOSC domain-containing protein [Geminocystis sp. CENA526]|uniref:MOSC domain-containing protein n=1 Tax=Geminocystis sp. CENA526 TaxID=1355871 RepID=UPI003D6DFB9C
MKIHHLFIYPIKSCQGISLTKGEVTFKGLKDFYQPAFFDREFMLVDEKGNFLTQRQYPQMATIKVKIDGNKLCLSCQNSSIEPFKLIPKGENLGIEVKIWRDTTIAIDQGNQVANWFKQALNLEHPCRLVRQSPKNIRAINPKYSTQENQPVSFADGFPYLLTNTASLAELNSKLQQKYSDNFLTIKMERFRPNIVIETETPFIEDTWKTIVLDRVPFHIVKPCSRCNIITTDQKTGQVDDKKEPLLTLRSFRNTSDGIMFGQNMIPQHEGIIKISRVC